MQSSDFNHIPANIRLPLFYVEMDPSLGGTGTSTSRSLIMGQMFSDGEAAPNIPQLVTSLDQSRKLFGPSSYITKQFETYRTNDDFFETWGVGVAEDPAGAAAAGTIAVAGAATASGTIALYVQGELIRIGVAKGAAAAAVATSIATAIQDDPFLPVTAGAVAGDVTVTAKSKGALGNDIDLRTNYLGLAGGEETPTGLTITITPMAGGATDPETDTAWANLGGEEFDYIDQGFADTTNLDHAELSMNDEVGRWAWDKQVYGHVFSAKRDTLGNLSTFGNTRNDPHATLIGYQGSPTPPWAWSAAWTAQAAKALSNHPARPLQSLTLSGVRAPSEVNRFTLQEQNVLAFDGIAPWTVTNGKVAIQRSLTTYQKNAFGIADDAYLDVQTLALSWHVLRRLRFVVTSQLGRVGLANDDQPISASSPTVNAKIVRGLLIAEGYRMQALGWIENMEAFKAGLVVERDPQDPNRLNVLFQPDYVNALRVFAVINRFRLQYAA